MSNRERIHWAPRVQRHKIRRLYATDAQGIVDEELIDEVAFAFLARCESILEATEAHQGRVRCRGCGRIVQRRNWDKEELIQCGECGWEVTWGDYLHSYQHRQLHGGGAVPVFEGYVRRMSSARTPRQRMMLIDWLIHQCHMGGEGPTRPVAQNLIAGRMHELVRFLDELAYGPGSSPGARQVRDGWRRRTREAFQRWGSGDPFE
ncbi:MAG: hypothetical protein PVJ27_01545 [Candidatus Brocadiaceae bacterium]